MIGIIYFIQMGDGGPVKIGYTADLAKRINSLNCGSPHALNVLGTIPGTTAVERALHKLFKPYRMRLEWFEPAPEVIEWIKANNGNEEAGEAVVESLIAKKRERAARIERLAPVKPAPDKSLLEGRLLSARQAIGLTQGQLAKRAGLSGPYISQIENGVRGPRLSAIVAARIAAALGVDFDWLVSGSGKPMEVSNG
jgi:DNA-binding XRE family transcriptional regulator